MRKYFLICTIITFSSCNKTEQNDSASVIDRVISNNTLKCDGDFVSGEEFIDKSKFTQAITSKYFSNYLNVHTSLKDNGSDYQKEFFNEIGNEFTNSSLENITTLAIDKELKACDCQAKIVMTPFFGELLEKHHLTKSIAKNGYIILPFFDKKVLKEGIIINYSLTTDSGGKVNFDLNK
jgi:phosphoribosylpyrophosphate synthetase